MLRKRKDFINNSVRFLEINGRDLENLFVKSQHWAGGNSSTRRGLAKTFLEKVFAILCDNGEIGELNLLNSGLRQRLAKNLSRKIFFPKVLNESTG